MEGYTHEPEHYYFIYYNSDNKKFDPHTTNINNVLRKKFTHLSEALKYCKENLMFMPFEIINSAGTTVYTSPIHEF